MIRPRMNLKRRESSEPCSPGDACDCAKCRGRLKVVNTEPIPSAGVRIWYLACNLCGGRPENNKLVVPLKFFPQRNRE